MLIDLLFERGDAPFLYLAIVTVIVGSIVLHELGHALAATWERDPTPKMMGHLTWNPVVHMGWLSIALVAFMGIGWGRTPVNRRYFRHRRWGEVLVSFAGPSVNLLLAAVGAAALAGSQNAGAPPFVTAFWKLALHFNVLLFLFNMIPLPPLDGFGVLDALVDLGDFGALLRRAGMLSLVIAIVIVNSRVFDVVTDALAGAIAGAFGAAL